MQCVRCSHQLPPRADRCLRCFALNLENAPGPLSMPLHDSGPVRPVKVRITEPEPEPTPELKPAPEPEPIPEPKRAPEPEPRRTSLRAGPLSRLLAWSIDAALLCALLAAHLYGATLLVDTPYPLEALSSQLPLWAALAACLAVAYSWLFTALSARTPGMALAGQRLETLRGGAPGPAAALVRALLSLLSAPGVFGFLLALFDSRGQTLHDKLCGCVVVISPPDA